MFIRVLFIGLLALVGCNKPGTKNPAEFVEFYDIVTDKSASRFIREFNYKLKANPDQLFILITSPGGSVIAGRKMISVIEQAQARGVEVNCAVTEMAFSMGFHLLASCDNRYATRSAMLLFHEASFYAMMHVTPSVLEELKQQILTLIGDLEEALVEKLGTDRETFDKHNKAETLWTGYTIEREFPDFLELVDDVTLPDGTQLVK